MNSNWRLPPAEIMCTDAQLSSSDQTRRPAWWEFSVGGAGILLVTVHTPLGVGWVMRFLALVPAWYIEPLSIGSSSWPLRTWKLSRLRCTVQRVVSSDVPSNSSDLVFCGHWLGAPVTRTPTVAELLMPLASVTVTFAV